MAIFHPVGWYMDVSRLISISGRLILLLLCNSCRTEQSANALTDEDRMDSIEDGMTLAHAMVNTVRDPLLVLGGDLQVLAASRSFYSTFETTAEATMGRKLYDLGSGGWNSPALRDLLDRIVPEHGVMDHFEVEEHFPDIGHRVMLLNARSWRFSVSRRTRCSRR
jgi:PAS domain-containing protein